MKERKLNMKQYNFIIDNKLITVNASSVERGRVLAELTLEEMNHSID